MKSLKKSVIAVLVIGTLSIAGTAFAYRGQRLNGQGCAYMSNPAFVAQEWRATRGADFAHHAQFFNEMPQEIRDKEVEAEKLRIELNSVLSQKPLNKDKAAELRGVRTKSWTGISTPYMKCIQKNSITELLKFMRKPNP